MKNLVDFILTKLLTLLENIGYILIGTALSLAISTPPNMTLSIKFAGLGAASFLLSIILGAIDNSVSNNNIVKSAKKTRKRRKKKRRK